MLNLYLKRIDDRYHHVFWYAKQIVIVESFDDVKTAKQSLDHKRYRNTKNRRNRRNHK